MSSEMIDTLVIGAGQAGLAMSEHLSLQGVPHLVLERHRIVERWRTERWDSLVANGPAWHDRFPNKTFAQTDPDGFASRAQIVEYFEGYAQQIAAPVRCGVEVQSLQVGTLGGEFHVQTSSGEIVAKNVVVATGPFQRPLIPTLVPAETGIEQMHSSSYRNPEQLAAGAVLVVGAGSSGVQIADELVRAGRRVYLSVGPHNRPPRRYRGKDFCWWLGVLGEWDAKVMRPGTEHVTIAVSGARGGHTVDFRALAASGVTLLGRTGPYKDGVLEILPDLGDNIRRGDADYLRVLRQADEYAQAQGLDLPLEPQAHQLAADPECVTHPLSSVNLSESRIKSIVWATGYATDFSWLKADAFDDKGRPAHDQGVAAVPGLYFIGLPWLTRRASPFIWGVWHDAAHLAKHIVARAHVQ